MAKNKATAAASDENREERVELQAIEPIKHDGLEYAPGERLAVSAETADVLILSGAACLPLPPVLAE